MNKNWNQKISFTTKCAAIHDKSLYLISSSIHKLMHVLIFGWLFFFLHNFNFTNGFSSYKFICHKCFWSIDVNWIRMKVKIFSTAFTFWTSESYEERTQAISCHHPSSQQFTDNKAWIYHQVNLSNQKEK